MRKGFDGLAALVTAAGEDPYSGQLYVFVSRRRDRAKILAFQKGGLVLWYKRLDLGRFQIHRKPSTNGAWTPGGRKWQDGKRRTRVVRARGA